MIILSLFDGMSCGQVALERVGIKIKKYYSSEIDRYAIKITMKNYPNTIQLGNITKWKEWNIERPDLILAGSPCQGFSFAGKQLNFNDPRSALFFVFADILNYYNPKYFLFENVVMKKEYQDIISNILKVHPIKINSSLVSAQSRKRLYWCNWKVEQPEDKKIYLKDIIEYGITDKNKSYCIDSNYFKGGNLKQYFEKKRRQIIFNKPSRINTYGNGGQGQRVYAIEGKSVSLNASCGGWGAKTGLYYINDCYRKLTPLECERLQTIPDEYTASVRNTQRYKCLVMVGRLML